MKFYESVTVEDPANVIADALQIEPIYIAPFVAAPILLVLLIALLATTGKKSKKITAEDIIKKITQKTENSSDTIEKS